MTDDTQKIMELLNELPNDIIDQKEVKKLQGDETPRTQEQDILDAVAETIAGGQMEMPPIPEHTVEPVVEQPTEPTPAMIEIPTPSVEERPLEKGSSMITSGSEKITDPEFRAKVAQEGKHGIPVHVVDPKPQPEPKEPVKLAGRPPVVRTVKRYNDEMAAQHPEIETTMKGSMARFQRHPIPDLHCTFCNSPGLSWVPLRIGARNIADQRLSISGTNYSFKLCICPSCLRVMAVRF